MSEPTSPYREALVGVIQLARQKWADDYLSSNQDLAIADALLADGWRKTTEAQPETGKPIVMTYRNWRGEIGLRAITPQRLWWGTTEWHPEPGWLLTAWDCGKAEVRDFALADCQFADLSDAQPIVEDEA